MILAARSAETILLRSTSALESLGRSESAQLEGILCGSLAGPFSCNKALPTLVTRLQALGFN